MRLVKALSYSVRQPLADLLMLLVVASCLLGICASVSRGEYTVGRVVGGLNQPMYVTQAPGDNTSIYIVERNDGGNQLGRIRRYNLQTSDIHDFFGCDGLNCFRRRTSVDDVPSGVSIERPVLHCDEQQPH